MTSPRARLDDIGSMCKSVSAGSVGPDDAAAADNGRQHVRVAAADRVQVRERGAVAGSGGTGAASEVALA